MTTMCVPTFSVSGREQTPHLKRRRRRRKGERKGRKQVNENE
jgi:hypothetical protein